MAIFERDVFDVIKDDHRLVMDVFGRLVDDTTDVGQRAPLVDQLRAMLLPHMAAEEQVFYPILDKSERGHERHLHAEEEHVVARLVLDELTRLDTHSDHFVPRCEVLRELLRLHIAEEEGMIFFAVRSRITNQETIDMIRPFEEAKSHFSQQHGTQLPKAA